MLVRSVFSRALYLGINNSNIPSVVDLHADVTHWTSLSVSSVALLFFILVSIVVFVTRLLNEYNRKQMEDLACENGAR